MIVGDSSYIVHALLKDASLFERELIVTPDIALYEVMNAIWKHAAVLRDIKDGTPYIERMFELTSSRVLEFLRPSETMVTAAYKLSLEKKCTFYDAIFVTVALTLGIELKTFDEAQRRLV
jgi:predicted nucleic acid-binding protein